MTPIRFTCQQFISLKPEGISSNIADTAKWEEFNGYGLLPGIKKATFETKTEEMIGSRIAVQNTDGSTHIEEIYRWEPEKTIGMKLHEFSPPLNKLATHFMEDWTFDQKPEGTLVQRSFELHPTSFFTKPFLWLISLMFRRAIAKHLAEMAHEANLLT